MVSERAISYEAKVAALYGTVHNHFIFCYRTRKICLGIICPFSYFGQYFLSELHLTLTWSQIAIFVNY